MTRAYGKHGQCEATAKTTGERCGQPAIGPHGKCYSHGGKSRSGPDHWNHKHGGFVKKLKDHLSESEVLAMDEMVEAFEADDPEEALQIIRQQAAEIYVRYLRSADTRFLTEYRQLVETFNLAPNESEHFVSMEGEVEHTGAVDFELDEETRQVLDELTGADDVDSVDGVEDDEDEA